MGVAAGVYPTCSMVLDISGAFVQIRYDGSINLSTGCTELGQGSNTALAQILAEELGVPLDEITVVSGDSETCPLDVGAVSSRQTHSGGNAIMAAAQKLKKILQDIAGDLLEANPEGLIFKDGKIFVEGSPEKSVSFREVVRVSYRERTLPLMAEGWHVPNTTGGIDPETGRGEAFPAYEYQAIVAEVEVDTDTGLVEVLKLHAAIEGGRIVNPLLAECQLEGGMMMGIGFGLRENLHPYYPEVDGLSPDYSIYQQATNLADYLVATSEDVPFLNEAFVDYPDPVGPHGAVGIGEFTMIAAGAAVANAIHDAIGVRISSAPCTPERILSALQAKETKSKGAK